MSDATSVRVVLIGLGNLGRRFARLIAEKHESLVRDYGLDVRIVGAADSRGAAIDRGGLNGLEIERAKAARLSVGELPRIGRPGMTGIQLIESIDADVLCEATPVNLDTGGEPGISHVRAALKKGMHVATPNKGPIVLAYRELTELARENGVELRFDGTVAGGLPALGLGVRELRGAEIIRIESVPNLTTGYVIDLLASGIPWDEATERAQKGGMLEADPAWDLQGWDAAAKLAIIANAVLGIDAKIDGIEREGIVGIDPDRLRDERAAGRVVRLVARADRGKDGLYSLKVGPEAIPADHPFGRLKEKEMAILYETDIFGTIVATIEEETPLPSAATILRDLLSIYLD